MKSMNEPREISRAIAKAASGATIKYREVAQKCQQNFREKNLQNILARSAKVFKFIFISLRKTEVMSARQ